MVVIQPRLWLLLMGAAGLTWLLAQRYDPRRRSGRLLGRCVTGLALLLTWNLAGLPHLGINPLSVLAAGALGAPGLALLLAVRMP